MIVANVLDPILAPTVAGQVIGSLGQQGLDVAFFGRQSGDGGSVMVVSTAAAVVEIIVAAVTLAVASVAAVIEVLATTALVIFVGVGTASRGRLVFLTGDAGGAAPLGLAAGGTRTISFGLAGGTLSLGIAGDIHMLLGLCLLALRAAVSSGRHLLVNNGKNYSLYFRFQLLLPGAGLLQ